MHPPIPASTFRERLLWLLGRRRRLRVTGASMLPHLSPGQEVLLSPHAYANRSPQVGDVVAARHPYQPDLKIIKRVVHLFLDGRCLLEGDNPEQSTDSRSFGSLDPALLLGKITCRFP